VTSGALDAALHKRIENALALFPLHIQLVRITRTAQRRSTLDDALAARHDTRQRPIAPSGQD
jgi:hypothetical protein